MKNKNKIILGALVSCLILVVGAFSFMDFRLGQGLIKIGSGFEKEGQKYLSTLVKNTKSVSPSLLILNLPVERDQVKVAKLAEVAASKSPIDLDELKRNSGIDTDVVTRVVRLRDLVGAIDITENVLLNFKTVSSVAEIDLQSKNAKLMDQCSESLVKASENAIDRQGFFRKTLEKNLPADRINGDTMVFVVMGGPDLPLVFNGCNGGWM